MEYHNDKEGAVYARVGFGRQKTVNIRYCTATATIISMTHTEQKLPWERMNSEISPI